MDINAFFKSGKSLLADTKAPKPTTTAGEKKRATKAAEMSGPGMDDPHAVFVRRVVTEKPKPKDVVEQLKRFITAAEAAL
jgi:hypothetical protein